MFFPDISRCDFCLMSRRPPSSTRTDPRFPYAPLFRSRRRGSGRRSKGAIRLSPARHMVDLALFAVCLAATVWGVYFQAYDGSPAMPTLYISPTGSGSGDGSSAANAATLEDLPQLIAAAGPGGEVLLLADQGDYTAPTGALAIVAGGTASAPVTIRGVD